MSKQRTAFPHKGSIKLQEATPIGDQATAVQQSARSPLLLQFQKHFGNRATAKLIQKSQERQAKLLGNRATAKLIQKSQERQAKLPTSLKQGMERLSGIDLSDVDVHYQSSKPAQLNALAYAQGNQIYLGPQQEKHLPHEAWHIVQQKQGNVAATGRLNGLAINDSSRLEREASTMEQKATQFAASSASVPFAAPQPARANQPDIIQRLIVTPGYHTKDGENIILDYAIIKTLFAIQKATGDDIQILTEKAPDLSSLAAQDTLYIVAHGSEQQLWGYDEKGSKITIPKSELATRLNHPQIGIQNPIKEIRFLACKQALRRTDINEELSEEDRLAPVEYVAKSLNVKGVPISGAQGYTFATASTTQTGLSRVIKNRQYYSLMERDPKTWNEEVRNVDIDSLIELPLKLLFVSDRLANIFSDQDIQIIMGKNVQEVNQERLINGLIELVEFLGGKINQSVLKELSFEGMKDNIISLLGTAFLKEKLHNNIRDFLKKRDRIYTAIKDITKELKGLSLPMILESLDNNPEWHWLLAQQETLFDQVGLFWGKASKQSPDQLGYKQSFSIDHQLKGKEFPTSSFNHTAESLQALFMKIQEAIFAEWPIIAKEKKSDFPRAIISVHQGSATVEVDFYGWMTIAEFKKRFKTVIIDEQF